VLIIADLVMFTLAFKLATALRAWVFPLIYSGFPEGAPSSSLVVHWWFFPLWLFIFLYEGLYNGLPFWDEVRKVSLASLLATTGIFVVVSLGQLSDYVSRTVVVTMGMLMMCIYPFVRIQIKAVMRGAGLLKKRVLILGAGETGRLVLRTMRREPNLGYEVAGFLDDDPEKAGTEIDGTKVHSGVDSAERYIGKCDISEVVIAMPGAPARRHQELINSLQHKVEHILFMPDLFGMAVMGTSVQHFFDEQAIALQVKNNLAQPANYYAKRAFDYIVGSTLALVLALPMLAISIAIRATSRGPALFVQSRIGRYGRLFPCYKFRTMHMDADEMLKDILEANPGARAEWDEYWKLSDDPRVTAVGRFLRRTSLDELPQILNVLRGEMSLVGPRPYLPREEDQLGESRDLILNVLPGITGLWQVSGRSSTTYQYRMALDTWYVRNWGMWLDVVILLKTIRAVFRTGEAC
jgi:undecaprenyl-phosphate galactose phosphotransferase